MTLDKALWYTSPGKRFQPSVGGHEEMFLMRLEAIINVTNNHAEIIWRSMRRIAGRARNKFCSNIRRDNEQYIP